MRLDLQVKIGSALVLYDQYIGLDGRADDIVEIRKILADPKVHAWLSFLKAGALLPIRREDR